MRFVHSADLQLGARFAQFGAKADLLRAARIETLGRVLATAEDRAADAVLIAGDLFEDNQVADSVITAALEKFRLFPDLPVFILPGNHDPASGPASIWNRSALRAKPANVTVFDAAGVRGIGAGAWLIASPLRQKVSTVDPSLSIAELAATVPADAIRIGITHGSPAIPALFKPNDFPIALDAATRASLDYLAIGHWHSWQIHDQGRMVMPGTPEPDQFESTSAGFAALVEIPERGSAPRIEQIPVSTLDWRVLELDLAAEERSRSELEHALGRLRACAARTVVRVGMVGMASPATIAESREWLECELAPFAAWQIQDLASPAFSEAELDALRREHPLLGRAVSDLAQIERFLTRAETPAPVEDGAGAISLREAQQIFATARIEMSELDQDFFRSARYLLLEALRNSES